MGRASAQCSDERVESSPLQGRLRRQRGYNGGPVAGSSNGRTPDSGSGSQGSSPCPAASQSLATLGPRPFRSPREARSAHVSRKRRCARSQCRFRARGTSIREGKALVGKRAGVPAASAHALSRASPVEQGKRDGGRGRASAGNRQRRVGRTPCCPLTPLSEPACARRPALHP